MTKINSIDQFAELTCEHIEHPIEVWVVREGEREICSMHRLDDAKRVVSALLLHRNHNLLDCLANATVASNSDNAAIAGRNKKLCDEYRDLCGERHIAIPSDDQLCYRGKADGEGAYSE